MEGKRPIGYFGLQSKYLSSYYGEHQIVCISVHRPLATLVRVAKIAKDWEFFCLSAETPERQKQYPFGRLYIEYESCLRVTKDLIACQTVMP